MRGAVVSEPLAVVSVLPVDRDGAAALPSEAIAGHVSLLANGRADRGMFRPNPAFVAFMHDLIRREAPGDPSLADEARRLGSGWVYVIDGRTPTPAGPVPIEDILGGFPVRGGVMDANSYVANPNHQLLTDRGVVRLPTTLHQRWIEALRVLT